METKSQITKELRNQVWKKHMGNSGNGICCRCRVQNITKNKFICRHMKTLKNGGKTELSNLLPICFKCNGSLHSSNIENQDLKNSGISINKIIETQQKNKEIMKNIDLRNYRTKFNGIIRSIICENEKIRSIIYLSLFENTMKCRQSLVVCGITKFTTCCNTHVKDGKLIIDDSCFTDVSSFYNMNLDELVSNIMGNWQINVCKSFMLRLVKHIELVNIRQEIIDAFEAYNGI